MAHRRRALTIFGIAALLLSFAAFLHLRRDQAAKPKSMIENEINALFIALDEGNRGGDFDGVLHAFERLNAKASKSDLPALVEAIQSPRNSFWTRELLSEPICRLGGVDCLEPLLEALQRGFDEGRDNDGFAANLWNMAEADPARCRARLQEFLSRSDFKRREQALWLLDFCKTDNGSSEE